MKKKNRFTIPAYLQIFSSFLIISFLITIGAKELRKPFPIPIANVIPFFDSNTGRLDEVFITYRIDANKGWTISDADDRYIKDTQRMSREHTHRELQHVANYLSPFEAEQINRVCNTFVRTLTGLEKDLERGRWGKCLYLDNYLTFFLRGFYYLLSAARRSRDYLPKVTCISEKMYDSPADSTRSIKRVQSWKKDPERVIKLRISIRELVFQIKAWQEDELDNPKRDMWQDNSGKFVQAYELFVRYYFNLIPLPEIKKRR